MTPTAKPSGLTPELIEQVKILTPEEQDELFALVIDADMPPDTRTEEEWAAEIKRRIEEAESGTVPSLTREEAAEQVRTFLREKYGFEL